MESECCGASFYEPGYPDNDICSSCGEHSGPMEDEEELFAPHGSEMEAFEAQVGCFIDNQIKEKKLHGKLGIQNDLEC